MFLLLSYYITMLWSHFHYFHYSLITLIILLLLWSLMSHSNDASDGKFDTQWTKVSSCSHDQPFCFVLFFFFLQLCFSIFSRFCRNFSELLLTLPRGLNNNWQDHNLSTISKSFCFVFYLILFSSLSLICESNEHVTSIMVHSFFPFSVNTIPGIGCHPKPITKLET